MLNRNKYVITNYNKILDNLYIWYDIQYAYNINSLQLFLKVLFNYNIHNTEQWLDNITKH